MPSREVYGRAEERQRGTLRGQRGRHGQQDTGGAGAEIHREPEQHVAGERQAAVVPDGMPRQPADMRADVPVASRA